MQSRWSGKSPVADSLARAVLLSMMTVLCALTWRKWGSLTIDCGREIYIPATLSEGKRLYFDAWYLYGPLIPYWNALLFHTFGIHLWLLETAGIAIVGIMTLLTYSLSRIFLPVMLSFVAAFAFVMQAFQLDLFNYVLPYSYPAAYGAMMFLILTWLLVRDCIDRRPWTMLVAGCVAGLEGITKIEFGMAAFLLISFATVLRLLLSHSFLGLMKDAAFCTPGLLLCTGVYGWYIHASDVRFMFAQNIPVLPDAYFIRTVGQTWSKVAGFTSSPLELTKWTALGVLGVVTVAGAVRLASASPAAGRLVAASALSLCAFHLVITYIERVSHRIVPAVLTSLAPFVYFNRGMVLVAAAFLVHKLVQWRLVPPYGGKSALLVLSGAAIAVGTRALAGIEPMHYSIFYDTTAFIVFLIALREVACALHVPELAKIWTWTSILLCCGIVSLTAPQYQLYKRSFPISSSRGSILTEPEMGDAFSAALAFLNGAKERSEKFVAWPEEAAFYYFAGAAAPTPWWSVMPGVLPPGKLTSRFLDDLDRQQVKYIALSNRSTPEYGIPIFGVDYDQDLYRWLEQNFRVVRTFGDFQRTAYPPHWAVQIWERKRFNN